MQFRKAWRAGDVTINILHSICVARPTAGFLYHTNLTICVVLVHVCILAYGFCYMVTWMKQYYLRKLVV